MGTSCRCLTLFVYKRSIIFSPNVYVIGLFECLDGYMQDIYLEKRRKDHRANLSSSLSNIVDHLSSIPEVKRVVLFGSYVAGRRDLFTDLDLLVIMESDLDFVQRTAELYRQLSFSVDLDMLVYTPEEFERMKHKGFIRLAVENGRVLYEK